MSLYHDVFSLEIAPEFGTSSDDLSSYKISFSFNICLLYLRYSSKVSKIEIGDVKQPISISLTFFVHIY